MLLIADDAFKVYAQRIAAQLDVPLIVAQAHVFNDSETRVSLLDLEHNKRELLCVRRCILLHAMRAPINESVIRLIQTIEEIKKLIPGLFVHDITVCLPYLPYMRGEAPFLLNILAGLGVKNVISIDAHQDFDVVPLELTNLLPAKLFSEHIMQNHPLGNVVLVAPDSSATKRCQAVLSSLNTHIQANPISVVCMNKVRTPRNCIIDRIDGEVNGKCCILIDDIIDTGKTLESAAFALKEKGAQDIFAYVTHGVLSSGASERLQNTSIKRLTVTDTVAGSVGARIEKISVVDLVSESIKNILCNN
jgi:ribose-phosphate pyrophosphokinase